MGTEKGEIITLTDNREYVCLGIISAGDGKRYLYLVTTSEPIEFCFAEETIVNDDVRLRIVGSKEEKHRLFDLLKVQTQANPNGGLQHV